MPIISQGEKLRKGNRLFELQEAKIIFKYNKKIHIDLLLPKLRKNLTKQYNQLIELTHNKQHTVYIELTDEFIYLTFEPIQITENKTPKQRVAAIDMNPEYIGFSITDYTNGQKVLFTQTFDVSCFVKKLGLSSNHIKQKKQVRKHHYELIEIAKRLTNIARHYNCKSFAIEDLNLQNNKLNKEANRKNKNKWCRQLLVKQIKKRCKIYNIKLEEINPAYLVLLVMFYMSIQIW